jgi:tRNA-splicing ligase RtcB (3'-phosphate/5'-hydroxy nucleic acid ligase)
MTRDKPKIFGQHEPQTLAQLEDVASRAERAALMADGHLGYVMPIGGVAAYRDRVSVVGVGFDIACGNAAIRTDMTLADLGGTEQEVGARLNILADEIQDVVSFGMGRKNLADDAPVDDPLFDDPAWDVLPAPQREPLRRKAREQLGTVGSGNHYVNLFADEEDTVWVGVHFGSRGFGHKTASGFLAIAQGLPFDDAERKRLGVKVREGEMDSPPVLFEVDSEVGQGYIEAMQLAGRYAYAGRDAVVDKVLGILGAGAVHEVHNHHNFAFREEHAHFFFGREKVIEELTKRVASQPFLAVVGASGSGKSSVVFAGLVPHFRRQGGWLIQDFRPGLGDCVAREGRHTVVDGRFRNGVVLGGIHRKGRQPG